jgi:hypothetical protein
LLRFSLFLEFFSRSMVMQTLKQTCKRVLNPSAWRQWAIVFLAGVVLLVSTACNSSSDAATSPRGANVGAAHTDSMYPYKDTERDTRASDAKASRLIRQAEQRLDKATGPKAVLDNVTPDKSLEQQVDKAGKSARQAVENIGKSTQRAAENAAENTQKGLDKLTPSANRAENRAVDAANRATNPS